jgi:RecA-family ATPase
MNETNRHFDVKLVPEFVDAEYVVFITFPDKSGESLTLIMLCIHLILKN